MSEYNRDQLISLRSIRQVLEQLTSAAIEQLRDEIRPYLHFRTSLNEFQVQYLDHNCQKSCFETRLSACCGFESIITFFSDQAINCLLSSPHDLETLFHVLNMPNDTGKCVFLGEKGCLWVLRPISCAMFFCNRLKEEVFAVHPGAAEVWEKLQRQEKEYTWPTKPVLFDHLEEFFLDLGAKSPHMYFHQSPGLLRLKSKWGL